MFFHKNKLLRKNSGIIGTNKKENKEKKKNSKDVKMYFFFFVYQIFNIFRIESDKTIQTEAKEENNTVKEDKTIKKFNFKKMALFSPKLNGIEPKYYFAFANSKNIEINRISKS